jgi:NAD(P)H-quinone oxidoreductase subunit 2
MDLNTLAAQLNAGTILPESIVLGTLLFVIVGDLILGRKSSRTLAYAAVMGLLAAIASLTVVWNSDTPNSFLGAFIGDDLSIAFRGIIALSSAVTILMSVRYIEQTGTALAEFVSILTNW